MLYQIVLFIARKKLRFIKNQEVDELELNFRNDVFIMNKIVNRFLLTGDKFMHELHLRQPRFTYSACGSFSKHRERIRKFPETSNLKHIHKNELDKACFSHDPAYSDSKDLTESLTISDNILKDQAYQIAVNAKYDDIKED